MITAILLQDPIALLQFLAIIVTVIAMLRVALSREDDDSISFPQGKYPRRPRLTSPFALATNLSLSSLFDVGMLISFRNAR